MARVPGYGDPRVAPDVGQSPNVRQNVATPAAAFGAGIGRQIGEVGDAVTSASMQLLRAEQAEMKRAKQEADYTRVNEALNQLRESELDLTFNDQYGYTRLKGVQALERPDKKPLSSEYTEKLDKRRSELVASLGNDEQRQLFESKAAERLTSFRGNLMGYEAKEFQNYQLSVAEGTIGTATKQVGQFYNDPAKIDDGIMSIRSAVAQAGKIQGLSAEQVQLNTERLVSNAHMSALSQAVAQNPLYAEQYLRTYKDQMLPQDVLKARGEIETQAANYIADAKAQQIVYSNMGNFQPSDMDRAFNITVGTESGGQQFDSTGNPLISPKGATGIAQIMPETGPEAAKLAGLPWDENRYKTDANYNRQLGQAYFGNLVKKYNGDLDLSWAAYNAGQGKVEQARQDAAKAGRPGDWLTFLPKETQNYVAKNAREYAAGGGRPAEPTLADLQAQVDRDPDLANRPLAKKKAMEEVTRRFNQMQTARKSEQEGAFADAMRYIEQGGAYDRLPPDIKDKVNPTRFDDLRNFEKSLREGNAKTDLAVYQQLMENPERLREMSDAQFYALRTSLSEGDFKKFSDMRKPGAGGKEQPGTLRIESFNNIVKNRLASIGLEKSTRTPPAQAARIGAINKHLTDLILQEQQSMGRQMTDAEMTKFIDEQFLRTRGFKKTGWFNDGEVRKESLFSLNVSDIPADSVKAIKQDLTAKGFPDPTDQQVLQAYYEMDRRLPNVR